MPDKLNRTTEVFKIGSRTRHKIYWGDKKFVDALINEVNTNKGKIIGRGSFGTGYSVSYDGKKYLVKKTHKLPGFNIFSHEVEIANRLQNEIPDFVTQIKGARYLQFDSNAYIIYDLLQGDTLTKYIKTLITEYKSLPREKDTLRKNFSYLYQALKVSSEQLSKLGLSHCDIKPDNLFFNVQKKPESNDYDWSTAICWLIDFDGVRKFGESLYAWTPHYSIKNPDFCRNKSISDLLKELDINVATECQTLTEKYNAASCRIIWINDMKLDGIPDKPLSIQELGFASRKDYLTYRTQLLRNLNTKQDPVVQQQPPPTLPNHINQLPAAGQKRELSPAPPRVEMLQPPLPLRVEMLQPQLPPPPLPLPLRAPSPSPQWPPRVVRPPPFQQQPPAHALRAPSPSPPFQQPVAGQQREQQLRVEMLPPPPPQWPPRVERPPPFQQPPPAHALRALSPSPLPPPPPPPPRRLQQALARLQRQQPPPPPGAPPAHALRHVPSPQPLPPHQRFLFPPLPHPPHAPRPPPRAQGGGARPRNQLPAVGQETIRRLLGGSRKKNRKRKGGSKTRRRSN